MKLIHGNCKEVMKTLPDCSVDSVVTDPPYELGFMGKKWDASGIAYDIEMWSEVLRVLKPGGHLLAFSGSRTYHRMTCAIEDAGFEVRDQIMWVYGSGFPKSLAVDKALDGVLGKQSAGFNAAGVGESNGSSKFRSDHPEFQPYQPRSDAAKQWQGWGTALKPAHEPICVARKPLIGTVAENVLAHGAGAINVDGCRVGKDTVGWGGGRGGSDDPTQSKGRNYRLGEGEARPVEGRWPANLIHDGSEEVTRLAGDAARFFYCAKASKSDRDEGLDGLRDVRASEITGRAEGSAGLVMEGGKANPYAGTSGEPRKNHHPTVKPTDLMRYLCRLVTPPGGVVLDPFMGSGSTGKAAVLEGFDFIGIDMTPEYVEIAKARIQSATPANDNQQPDLFKTA